MMSNDKTAPDARISDSAAVDKITAVMSGNEWDSGTMSTVADILRLAGRTVADSSDYEDDDDDNPEYSQVILNEGETCERIAGTEYGHEHRYQGHILRHAHPHGDREHHYYGHDEDAGPTWADQASAT